MSAERSDQEYSDDEEEVVLQGEVVEVADDDTPMSEDDEKMDEGEMQETTINDFLQDDSIQGFFEHQGLFSRRFKIILTKRTGLCRCHAPLAAAHCLFRRGRRQGILVATRHRRENV